MFMEGTVDNKKDKGTPPPENLKPLTWNMVQVDERGKARTRTQMFPILTIYLKK